MSVQLSEDILLISWRGALSPSEITMVNTLTGVTRLQEFHRQLFTEASEGLREEINVITGVKVCEATAEIEAISNDAKQEYATGMMMQMYRLDGSLPAESWSERGCGVASATIREAVCPTSRRDTEPAGGYGTMAHVGVGTAGHALN
jgi:uncharacterized protein YbcI